MIAFAGLLCNPAEKAGIKVPENMEFDGSNLDDFRETHPHFFVYAMMQLGAPLPDADSHWRNAKVIAAVSDDEITKVTPVDLQERGFATYTVA